MLYCPREESQSKRTRAEEKSSTKKRGRPRKSEPTPEISVSQEEKTLGQDAPAVVAEPEPVEVVPAQSPGSLTSLLTVGSGTLESQPTCVLPAPASVPILSFVQIPLLTPALTPAPAPALAPVVANPTLGLVSDSVPVPSPTIVLDTDTDPTPATAPVPTPVPVLAPVPAPDAAPVLALSQAPLPAAAPATSQVETHHTESQGREALEQVLIEDSGPDKEEDISPSQDKRADEDNNTGMTVRENRLKEF